MAGSGARNSPQSRLMFILFGDADRGGLEIATVCLSPQIFEEDALLFEGGFTFRNFVADAFAIFMFVLWFWLFVSVAGDLFRRHDISGWQSALGDRPHPVFLYWNFCVHP